MRACLDKHSNPIDNFSVWVGMHSFKFSNIHFNNSCYSSGFKLISYLSLSSHGCWAWLATSGLAKRNVSIYLLDNLHMEPSESEMLGQFVHKRKDLVFEKRCSPWLFVTDYSEWACLSWPSLRCTCVHVIAVYCVRVCCHTHRVYCIFVMFCFA